jgi:hypothetical protein
MIRPATAGPAGRLLRLLLTPAVALLAVACDDSSSVQEPTVTDGQVAAAKAPVTIPRDPGRWADGYTTVTTAPFFPEISFNRTGGAVTGTILAGGRATVTFSGLSAFLGRTSTLHMTPLDIAAGGQYCKPVEAYLVRDAVEVHCYNMGTGLPADSGHVHFTLAVTRNYSDLAYAYADRPTSTNYSPADRGSWNPVGATTVLRTGVGQYQVIFYELQRVVWDANNNGLWQVNAVGSDNVFCKLASAGGSTAMFANVRCYTPAGTPADSKFTVLFVLPSSHIAYAYANQPSAPSGGYTPPAFDSWNPVGSWINVNHSSTGAYTIRWNGVSSEIVPAGTAQVTAEGSDGVQCVSWLWGFDPLNHGWYADVVCRSPNGERADSRFRVLVGS